MAPITLITPIIISVFLGVLSLLGENKTALNPFFITEYDIAGNRIQWMPGLPEIFSGRFCVAPV